MKILYSNVLNESILDLDSISPDDLDIIRSSQNQESIGSVVQKYLDPKYKPLTAPILRSIIRYRSADKDVNPFLAILEAIKKIPKEQDAWDILDTLPKINDNSIGGMLQYFDPNYKLLEVSDLPYMIKLLSILVDKNARKKYKNKITKEEPSIDLLLKDGVFNNKSNEIKKLMDSFLDYNEDTISLRKYFDNIDVAPNNYKSFIVQPTKNKNTLPDPLKNDQELKSFLSYLDKVFLKGNSSLLRDLLNFVRVPESLSGDKGKYEKVLLNSLYDYYKGEIDVSDAASQSASIGDIAKSKGNGTPFKIISYLKKLIASNKSFYNNDKLSAQFKLNMLLDSSKSPLLNKLLSIQIPNGDEDAISNYVMAFLESSIKQNYLYTSIQEALALQGKQPDEGYVFLGKYLVNMKSDSKSAYIDKFNKVWKSPKLKQQLLNARITRSNNRFEWLKAIINFIDDIKI